VNFQTYKAMKFKQRRRTELRETQEIWQEHLRRNLQRKENREHNALAKVAARRRYGAEVDCQLVENALSRTVPADTRPIDTILTKREVELIAAKE
jgi:hypothetical protein